MAFQEPQTPKQSKLNELSLHSMQDVSLIDFVTRNSRTLFFKLNLPQRFLELPASQLSDKEDHQGAVVKVHHLSVTNDHAERAVVALVQDFSGRLTKDEEQLQYILQVVTDHRKRYPQALKRTLLE